MNKLINLDLSTNKIRSIEPDAFNGLPALKSMNVSNNLLNSMQHKLFVNLKNLETLILSKNEIASICNDSFNGLGHSLVSLSLASNKLQFIKNDHLANLIKLQFLDLKSNSLAAIESNAFINMRDLNALFLSENCLFKITPILFQSQQKLDQLFLDFNLLMNIEQSFVNLKNLTTLNLAYNSIHQLTNHTFKGPNSLTNLNLSNNLLKSLNQSLLSLKSLQSIDLSNNNIRGEQLNQIFSKPNVNYEYYFKNTSIELVKLIKGNGKIEKLDLSFNNLSMEIRSISFNQMTTSLIHMDLRRTGLNGFSVDPLNVLKSLTYIDLSDNFIKLKARFLFNSPDLTYLLLSNVNLSNSDFETCLNHLKLFRLLKFIDLSHNNLETIKAGYFPQELNLLNLSFNKIKSIEYGSIRIVRRTALFVLDLSANGLTDLFRSIFITAGTADAFEANHVTILAGNNNIQLCDLTFTSMSLANLTRNGLHEVPSAINTEALDMSYNFVTEIKKITFMKMKALLQLYLASNQIKSIEKDSFYRLNNLVVLDLSNNLLTKLDNDTFSGLFNLKILDLTNNSVQHIQKKLFRDLLNLEQLFLNSNPIRLIEDESFIKQGFIKILEIDSCDYSESACSSITNSTFVGLESLRKLTLHKKILDSFINLVYIVSNLNPPFDKTILGMRYFKSRHVIYYKKDYTDWDCFIILYSVKHKVQLNLFDDALHNAFMNYCRQYSLNQLKFIISSYQIS
jgi:Leucine-rich repeat (LRR) protein